MNIQQAVEKVIAKGGLVFIGEYRGTKAEGFDWKDSTSGKTVRIVSATHSCEYEGAGGLETAAVVERLPEDADTSKIVPPFKRGQRVMGDIRSVKIDKGARRLTLAGPLVALA
jgi:hypothetical protein